MAHISCGMTITQPMCAAIFYTWLMYSGTAHITGVIMKLRFPPPATPRDEATTNVAVLLQTTSQSKNL